MPADLTDRPLKPCPWPLCRKANAMPLCDRFDDLWVAHVHCWSCGAGGPSMSGDTAAMAIEAASDAWNHRAAAAIQQHRESGAPQEVAK